MRRHRKIFGISVFVIAGLLIAFSPALAEDITVDPWFIEGMQNGEAVLEPGTTTYCNKDFWVENLGDDNAEVHIIRGSGDNYDTDMLGPGAKLGYKLQDRSIFATAASRGQRVDEARIVNSTMGDAKLKVYCK